MSYEDYVNSKGFITKAEASEKFGRHEVTLSKDIASALEKRDKEILPLLMMVTKDHVERLATDKKVTIALSKKLKKEGMQPRWYLHGTEAVPLFIKRNSKGKTTNRASGQSRSVSARQQLNINELPQDVAVRMTSLEKDVEHLKEAKQKLEEDKKEAREEAKEHKDIIKKQAVALRDANRNAIVDKQTIRELRLQIEAPKNGSVNQSKPASPVAKATVVETKTAKSHGTNEKPEVIEVTGMTGSRWAKFKRKHFPNLNKTIIYRF